MPVHRSLHANRLDATYVGLYVRVLHGTCRVGYVFVGLVNARVIIMCICEACKCHVSALYYLILVDYQYGCVRSGLILMKL